GCLCSSVPVHACYLVFILSGGDHAALHSFPTRRSSDLDPAVYRIYEIMGVYGETIKEIIHEKFGDGIMSAIDYEMYIERKADPRSEEHTSELQSREKLVCRPLLEKKKKITSIQLSASRA